jgi:hypothetical protein
MMRAARQKLCLDAARRLLPYWLDEHAARTNAAMKALRGAVAAAAMTLFWGLTAPPACRASELRLKQIYGRG